MAAAGRPEPLHPRRGNRSHPSRGVPCGPPCPRYRVRPGGQVCAGQPCLYGSRRPLGREGPHSWPRRPPLRLGGAPLAPEMLSVLETDPRWAGKSGSRKGPLRAGWSCPRFGEGVCQRGERKAFGAVIFILGPFFLVLYFFPFCSAICAF